MDQGRACSIVDQLGRPTESSLHFQWPTAFAWISSARAPSCSRAGRCERYRPPCSHSSRHRLRVSLVPTAFGRNLRSADGVGRDLRGVDRVVRQPPASPNRRRAGNLAAPGPGCSVVQRQRRVDIRYALILLDREGERRAAGRERQVDNASRPPTATPSPLPPIRPPAVAGRYPKRVVQRRCEIVMLSARDDVGAVRLASAALIAAVTSADGLQPGQRNRDGRAVRERQRQRLGGGAPRARGEHAVGGPRRNESPTCRRRAGTSCRRRCRRQGSPRPQRRCPARRVEPAVQPQAGDAVDGAGRAGLAGRGLRDRWRCRGARPGRESRRRLRGSSAWLPQFEHDGRAREFRERPM